MYVQVQSFVKVQVLTNELCQSHDAYIKRIGAITAMAFLLFWPINFSSIRYNLVSSHQYYTIDCAPIVMASSVNGIHLSDHDWTIFSVTSIPP